MPRPLLKLNLVNLSKEKTKPPAPEILGFPLDAPLKKITAEEELIHNVLNSSTVPRKRQGKALTGLKQADFLNPRVLMPNHVENAEGIGEEGNELPADSAISNLILKATCWGFKDLLLKIQLFLEIHSFHHIEFGIECQTIELPLF